MGRPRGVRNRLSVLAEHILEADGEAVIRKVVAMARRGNMVAAKLVLERIVPPRKSRAVVFDLPKIESPADILPAMARVLEQMAAGEIAPGEAAEIAAVLGEHRKTHEIVELEKRVTALEAATVKT